MGQTVAQRLASFVSRLQPSYLPPQVAEKARVITLHNLGVALAGYPAVQQVWRLSKRQVVESGPSARLLIDGLRLTPGNAAFANGILIHSRAQDDVHLGAFTHVGCTVFPAALAVAESLGKSGAEFVTALVAGYEVAVAVGALGGKLTTSRGFRATPVFAPIGAAAAAAKLMGLTEEQTANAIAIATSMSGGLGQTWVDGSHEWRFQVGQAARNGIFAAELAAEGGVGAANAFEGAAGFFQAFTGDRSLAERCGTNLGERWETLAVTFKPHPVCAILQTPTEIILRLKKEHRLTPGQVGRLRLFLNPNEAAYPGINGPGPFSDVGATLMSAQFCLSVALNRGEVRLANLYEFGAEEYRRLWERIEVLADPAIAAGSCRIEVQTGDGRILQDEFMSTPQTFNYTADEEAALIRSLLSETQMTAGGLEAFIQACLSVDQLPTVGTLIDLSKPGGK